jgi:hypothetical protein
MTNKSKKSSHIELYSNCGSSLLAPFCLIAFFLFSPFSNSFAQDSTQIPDTTNAAEARVDSLALPEISSVQASGDNPPSQKDIKPSKAMLHSLLIPGGGQRDNGKKKKALLFLATELVCLGGVIYETHLLGGADLTPFDKTLLRTDRNTFIIVWLCAKLFGMVDAYVDAQLKHFNVEDVTPPGLEKSEKDQKSEDRSQRSEEMLNKDRR